MLPRTSGPVPGPAPGGAPFWGSRFTNFVEIDVSGLNVIEGRAGVFVVPNEGPLDLTGRIASWGAN